ncbi:peptidoglycan-binding protein [Anaerosacchariphilus polymeriproducens]|uniref:Peptidoglycan-binding protein n=2 Tax=Anaerosacchariphilus polymeriproducens TaxID=1812858 RepID=A0A371ARX1_9FIRM|nr:peptidoglycan-binding protein [Anaerosacchariphilus polymeriproducens]
MNNKELGYTFDLNNTYYGSMCIKYGNAQIVKLGKKTRDVYLVQGTLRVKGYYTSTLDGYCGNVTDKAIREFQRDSGLTVDGECGANTWDKLFNS